MNVGKGCPISICRVAHDERVSKKSARSKITTRGVALRQLGGCDELSMQMHKVTCDREFLGSSQKSYPGPTNYMIAM